MNAIMSIKRWRHVSQALSPGLTNMGLTPSHSCSFGYSHSGVAMLGWRL